MGAFSRTELLLGPASTETLKNAHVAVFGIGGVGSYVVEALARAGVGELTLVDHDTVSETNLNRQLIATVSSVGKPKVEVATARVKDINPDCLVHPKQCFFLPDTADEFDFSAYSYVVDAIDTVTGKLLLIEEAKKAGVPVLSSMGTGNKLDPTAFRVADISKTTIDPLARIMRKELKKRGISHVKVVYSTEAPITPAGSEEDTIRRALPGSVSFVPSVAGLILAGEVIKDLTGVTDGSLPLHRKAEN